MDTAKMWLTAEQPRRLAVIGAGASGTEVASAFGRLGTEVILLEALDQILPLEDKEIARATAREIAKQNVKIVTGASVENVDDSGDSVKIEVGGETHEVDLVCIAAGRGADVEGLGLGRGAASRPTTAAWSRWTAPSAPRRRACTPSATSCPGPRWRTRPPTKGVIAAEDAAGMDTHPIDYPYVPRVTFCMPQVASFGLTEEQADGGGLRRGGGQGADGRRRRTRPSTATGPAWSRSSATRSTARSSAATSSRPRRPS
ncbi:MAG: FAD-dependent oxidoreductase [Thermoleophilaceae bacterium]